MSETLSPKMMQALTHLARREATAGTGRCEVTDSDTNFGDRCAGRLAAVRLEDGFSDLVCERHAETARTRGALVISL